MNVRFNRAPDEDRSENSHTNEHEKKTHSLINTEYLKTTTRNSEREREKRDNNNSKSCNWNWINTFLIRIVHKTKDVDDDDDDEDAQVERRRRNRASQSDWLWCCTRVADLASYVNCTWAHVTPQGENHLYSSHHQYRIDYFCARRQREEKSVNAINRRLHEIERTKTPSAKQKVNQFDAQFVAPQYGEAGIIFSVQRIS